MKRLHVLIYKGVFPNIQGAAISFNVRNDF